MGLNFKWGVLLIFGASMSQQSSATLPSRSTSAGHLPLDGFATHHKDTLLLMGRLALGVIFVTSGFEKLFALDAFTANLAGKGVPLAWIFARLGAGVEFFGGLAIVLGFATRLSALLMLAFVAVATAISHRYWEFEGAARVPQATNFFKNVSIAGGFFLLFAAGSGRFAIDGLFRRKSDG
jgi:putative oxidoreductase